MFLRALIEFILFPFFLCPLLPFFSFQLTYLFCISHFLDFNVCRFFCVILILVCPWPFSCSCEILCIAALLFFIPLISSCKIFCLFFLFFCAASISIPNSQLCLLFMNDSTRKCVQSPLDEVLVNDNFSKFIIPK